MPSQTARWVTWLSFTALAWVVPIPNVMGNNASPHPVHVNQPDGKEITLYLRGTEYVHWYEDTEGFTVVERDDRAYVYAALGPQRSLVATDRLVGVDPPPPGSQRRLIPPPFGRDLRVPRLPARISEAPQRTNPSGKVKNLVILMRFSNHQSRRLPTKDDYTKIFNAKGGDPVLAPTGSVRDYYLENSYGKLDLTSTVFEWVTLPKSEKYYANGDSGLTPRIAEAIRDALILADAQIDFRQFDQDGDGWVDAIAFVHSGYAAEFGGLDADGANFKDRIWSHRWSIPTWSSSEGVKVSDYHINPGLWQTSGTAPGRIGVICHETGHFFGLPDLYDTSQQGEGAGSWELMANSWGFDQSQQYPPHMSSWSKIVLNWIQPTDITADGQYQVSTWASGPQANQAPICYRIRRGFPTGEYLLVENRQPVGFDGGIPANGSGLCIWHIDEFKAANNEPGFPGQSGWPENNRHYKVALLQADGQYDLERGLNRGDAGDTFRTGFRDRIDGTTLPSTDRYQFGMVGPSGVTVQEVSTSSSMMTFRVRFPRAEPTETSRSAISSPFAEHPAFAAAHELASRAADGDEARYVRVMEDALKLLERDPAVPRDERIGPRTLSAQESIREKLKGDASLLANPNWRANQLKLWREVISRRQIGRRIVGGSPSAVGEFPHCVAVGRNGRTCCSGTLISPDVVVTAAHCVAGGCASHVFFGVDSNQPSSGRTVGVRAAVHHPQYDPGNEYANDIAILILDQQVIDVEPAPIARSQDIDAAYYLRLAGFGYTEFGQIGVQMTVDVAVASTDCQCATCPPLYGCHPGLEIVAGGNGVDSCNGDSGGPAYIVLDGKVWLAGATSRATRNAVQNCGDGGVYVRVDKYLDWIVETITSNGGVTPPSGT